MLNRSIIPAAAMSVLLAAAGAQADIVTYPMSLANHSFGPGVNMTGSISFDQPVNPANSNGAGYYVISELTAFTLDFTGLPSPGASTFHVDLARMQHPSNFL